MQNSLQYLDLITIFIYLGLTLFIGLFPNKKKIKTTEHYFLAGRNLGWVVLGLSIFSTNISTEHFIGLSSGGSKWGFSVAQFEWMAIFILIFLGWILAPILIRSKVLTVPQFFGERFNNKIRIYLATISIFTYFLTKISVALLAGSILFNQVFGLNMIPASILIILLTGIYTVVGGMYSVVRTQIFQASLLIIASILVTFFSINQVGGISTFTSKISLEYFDLIKPISDPSFPWLGILLGAPILGIWYWCTDQYIIQRILSAKSIEDARKGTVFTSVLKIVPILFFIIPGLAGIILYPDSSGSTIMGNLIMGETVPIGFKGIIIVGFLAALMSSLASVFNSAAALVTNDIYNVFKKNVKDQELLLVGRLSTTFFVFVTIALLPLMKLINGNIYLTLQELQAFISPPIAAIFLIAVFKKSTNSDSAFLTLIIGAFLGGLRFLLPLISFEQSIFEKIITFYININFLEFAIILFIISNLVYFTHDFFTKRSVINSYATTHTFNSNDFQINKNGYAVYSKASNTFALGSASAFVLVILLWEVII